MESLKVNENSSIVSIAPSKLYLALWNGNLFQIEEALKNGESVEERDFYGHRALHFALKCAHPNQREIVQLLLKYGARVRSQDLEGWRVMNHAVSTNNEGILRDLLEKDLEQFPQVVASKTNLTLNTLASIPNFYSELHLNIESWIPMVSHFLPSDTIKIWKYSDYIRFDLSLVGFEKMQWQRGNISIIFKGNQSSENDEISESSFYIINHDKKTYSTSVQPGKMLGKDLDETIHFILTHKNIAMAVATEKVSFHPVVNKSRSIFSKSDVINEAEIANGRWRNLTLYEMKDLALTVRIRPPRDPGHVKRAVIKPKVKKQALCEGNNLHEDIDDSEEEEEEKEDVLQSLSGLIKKLTNESTAIEIKAGDHYKVKFAVEKDETIVWEFSTKKCDILFGLLLYKRDEEEEEEDEQTGTASSGSAGGKSAGDDECEEILPIKRMEKHKGQYKVKYNGELEFIWDNSFSLLTSKHIEFKIYPIVEESSEIFDDSSAPEGVEKRIRRLQVVGSTDNATKTKTVTFEEWFKRPKNDVYQDFSPYKNEIDMVVPLEHKEFNKNFHGKVFMCKEFPISVHNFLPIIEVLSKTTQHFEKVKEFFRTKLPPGFPIQFTVPLLPSISAIFTFMEMKTEDLEMNESLFSVPEGYVLEEEKTEA